MFSSDGTEQTLNNVQIQFSNGAVGIALSGTNNRFTPEFEATGRIIIEASDGETLEIQIANADMTEPYEWVPSNSTEVIAFANHVSQ